MAESKRLVSDKIGGGNFYFLQPDATTYHMVKPGGGSSQPSQWRLTACELVNGTTSE